MKNYIYLTTLLTILSCGSDNSKDTSPEPTETIPESSAGDDVPATPDATHPQTNESVQDVTPPKIDESVQDVTEVAEESIDIPNPLVTLYDCLKAGNKLDVCSPVELKHINQSCSLVACYTIIQFPADFNGIGDYSGYNMVLSDHVMIDEYIPGSPDTYFYAKYQVNAPSYEADRLVE